MISVKTFDDIKKEFKKGNYWGLHTQINIYKCDPDLIRDSCFIKNYVIDLCSLIEMKRFGKCTVVNFGKDEKVAGYSMTQLIETSLISGHFANKTNAAYIDIFSCKPYNLQKVLEFTCRSFRGKLSSYTLTFRE